MKFSQSDNECKVFLFYAKETLQKNEKMSINKNKEDFKLQDVPVESTRNHRLKDGIKACITRATCISYADATKIT